MYVQRSAAPFCTAAVVYRQKAVKTILRSIGMVSMYIYMLLLPDILYACTYVRMRLTTLCLFSFCAISFFFFIGKAFASIDGMLSRLVQEGKLTAYAAVLLPFFQVCACACMCVCVLRYQM